MARLKPEPDLYDVQGWRALLDELREAPAGEVSPTYLAYAEAHLSAITNDPPELAAQTA